MPVSNKGCPKGKWRIGSGDCIYTSKKKATEAYQAYLAKKNSSKKESE